jgi:hypothetical protein
MEQPNENAQRYIGYPQAVEGPTIPYKKIPDYNPVLRGTLLVIGAWLFVLIPQRRGPRLTNEKCIQTPIRSEIFMDECWLQCTSKPPANERLC